MSYWFEGRDAGFSVPGHEDQDTGRSGIWSTDIAPAGIGSRQRRTTRV
jgi:hypothetical protein